MRHGNWWLDQGNDLINLDHCRWLALGEKRVADETYYSVEAMLDSERWCIFGVFNDKDQRDSYYKGLCLQLAGKAPEK